MESKFLYVMAHFDAETEKKFKEMHSLLLSKGCIKKQTPYFPSHITLGSFETNKESELVSKLKYLSKKTHKIPVSFNNIGLFKMDVLFIAPSVSYKLLDLHKEFDNNCANTFDWVPHVTVLIEDENAIEMALPLISQNFSAFSGYIESISIYEFSPSRFIAEEKLL